MRRRLISIVSVLMMLMTLAMPQVAFAGEDDEAEAAVDNMRIYAIYMAREKGTPHSSDRYGDATLIESDGEYLLIDTGAYLPAGHSTLVKTLKSIGVEKLNVCISHVHGDHTGGLSRVLKNFQVETVYLPDTKIANKYYSPNAKIPVAKVYSDLAALAEKNGAHVQYLSPSFRTHEQADVTDSIGVGCVSGKVIGPVGSYTVSQFKSQDGNCGTKEGHYLNNYSLSIMFSCGNIKYLTCGDAEKQEENNLIKKYGSELNADIMKFSHHSLYTSNTLDFVRKVSPRWSFEENHGFSGSSISTPVANGRKYGYNYKVASNKTNFIVDVLDSQVRVYKDRNNDGIINEKPLTGWIKVGSRYQYYAADGAAVTGWKKLNGKAYYLKSQNGFRATSTLTVKGVKCKFNSKGVLTSPARPKKAAISSITASTGSVKVKWNKVSGTTSYQVYRATSKTGTYTRVATETPAVTSFIDTDVVSGKTYYYKVRSTKTFAGVTLYGYYSDARSVKAK